MEDDPRQTAAFALLMQGGIVSAQVLNEFVAVARKKKMMDWPSLYEALRLIRLLSGPAVETGQTTHERAVELAEQYELHIYDAAIVASALLAGCDTLCTEDMQDGQRIEGLTIRNPFTASA